MEPKIEALVQADFEIVSEIAGAHAEHGIFIESQTAALQRRDDTEIVRCRPRLATAGESETTSPK